MPPSTSNDSPTDSIDSFTTGESHLTEEDASINDLSSILPLSTKALSALSNLARYKSPYKDNYPHPEGRAAVLICLFGNRTGTNLNVLLTTRAESLRTFPGQVALPGGKMDSTDINLEATARREAWEEVGVPIDTTRIRYLTTLPPFLMRNLSLVTPVVVFILDYSLKPELNSAEVSELFSFPLEGFLLSSPRPPVFREPPIACTQEGRPYHTTEDYNWYDGKPHRFHSFEADPKPITGVTAEMLIHTAMIAYGREPEYELGATGEMSHPELIERAMKDPRWEQVRREQRERETKRRKDWEGTSTAQVSAKGRGKL
ncbi:NUDIX hydrolase [Sporobolomyces salmoneus]|uniref:NUDIX hydrolase n=1 Tax=Sporobolomyces salmoneus TaxID=183962 RepID=UPI00317EA123